MEHTATTADVSAAAGSAVETTRVLVVDDEATLAHVLRSVLVDHGYDVATAGSAEEAAALLARAGFGVALVDIVLPGMSGLKLLEQIRSVSPDTEVVMMTSHGSFETALEAIRHGAYDYLIKPFDDVETVAIAVRRAAEKRWLTRRNADLLAEKEFRNRQLDRAVTRLSTLIDAGRTMGNFRTVGEVLDFFIGIVATELDVERASVMLIDESGRELYVAASRGLDGVDTGAVRVPLGEGVSGRVASTGVPFLVSDAASDPRMASGKHPSLSDSFICAPIVLSLPIKAWERVLGVLSVTNRRSGRPFDEDDLAYLSGMTGQVAVAIERTRHFEELQKAYDSLKGAQAQLVLSERVKAIGQIAAGVAHDFNNLLGAMLGRAQLAQWRLKRDEPDLDHVATDLESLTRFALQGAETIRRIQGFTRDRQGGRRAKVHLETVVRESIDMTRPKWQSECGAAGRAIRLDLRLGETPAIAGNTHDLVQAVNNLVFNAVEAMPSGGTLSIATRAGGDRVVLEVSDTGIGIDEATRARLFEPFFTTKEAGNGLGLGIVRDIVRAHGGEISVASEPGQGTCFTIALPMHAATGLEAVPDAAAAAGGLGPARVLLVDDIDDVRATFREMLASGGHEVREARGGAEALALLAAERFDVVLTDLSMPSMSGVELAREIKRTIPGLPVVLVTGWPGDRPAEEFRDAGIGRVVAKPCLRSDLLAAVDEALAKRP